MKINETQARALFLCRTPKSPSEVWVHWKNELSYSYVCTILSNLSKLGLMTKRNVRERGKNLTFYTTNEEGFGLAEQKLKRERFNGKNT